MASYWRRCDVITSHRRRCDVVFGIGHPLGRHMFVNKMLIAQENFLINFTDVSSIIMIIVIFKGDTLHDNRERLLVKLASTWSFCLQKHFFEGRMTRCWSVCLFDS